MRIRRRTFLELAAGAGLFAGASGLSRALRASQPTVTDRYFVFAYFGGGWDVLLSLDPRDPDTFTFERAGETGIHPAYETIPTLRASDWLTDTSVSGMTFGPYIGALAQRAERLAVLRGVAMESVAHEVARRHALTGRAPAGSSVRGSSVATWLAALLGEAEPIPNLVCATSSFNLGHPTWASGLETDTVADLFQALSPGDFALSGGAQDGLEAFFAAQEARATSPLEAEILANRRAARALVELDLASLFDLERGDAEMRGLREAFGVDSGSTGEGGPRALMAAQALTQGVARCVSFRAAGNLDSHQGADWQAEHGPNLQAGFDAIAALADHLEATPFGDSGESWLDKTTILCFSEFSREAVLNSNGGRDHNLVNSMLLLGGGVRGGQVIGQTSDVGMLPEPVDLVTGAPSDAGELLTNEHVARTLLASVGVTEDVGEFRKDPILALLEEP